MGMLSPPKVFEGAPEDAPKKKAKKMAKKKHVSHKASLKVTPSLKMPPQKVHKKAKKVAKKAAKKESVAEPSFHDDEDVLTVNDDASGADLDFGSFIGQKPAPKPVSKNDAGLLDGLMSDTPSVDIFHTAVNPTKNLMDNLMNGGF